MRQKNYLLVDTLCGPGGQKMPIEVENAAGKPYITTYLFEKC